MSYTPTNWENLPSTNTPVNANNLNKIENELANKNIISVGINSDITLSTSGEYKLTLDKIHGQIGNQFNLSNGRVVVGAGINHVLLTASIYTNRTSSSGGACNVYVYKNNSGIVQSINTVQTGSGNHTTNTSPVVVSVQQNDYFELAGYGYAGDTISRYSGTALTIEAID